jgi:YfiH family protein
MSPALREVSVGSAPVRALFSGGDRDLGMSGASAMSEVVRNREGLARAAGFDASRAVLLNQAHGVRAITVGAQGGCGAYVEAPDGFAVADASVTRAPGVALLALGADCAPVLLWAHDGSTVAAVHAGWRGLVAGVVACAVEAMDVAPGAIRAAIGPRIGPCCYPVDLELRRTMAACFGDDVVHGDAVDLALGVRRALAACGVGDEAVQAVGECTACGPGRWFSHRRDGARAGRQAGIVWIEELT